MILCLPSANRATPPATLLCTEYIFTVARGSVLPPTDYGLVGVIDGDVAKVTAFRKANVPPPMAMTEIQCDGSIVDIAFAPSQSSFAVLCRRKLEFYQWPRGEPSGQRPQLLSSVTLGPGGDTLDVADHRSNRLGGLPVQASFVGAHEIAILSFDGESHYSLRHYLIRLAPTESSTCRLEPGASWGTDVTSLATTVNPLQETHPGDQTFGLKHGPGPLIEISNRGMIESPLALPVYTPWLTITKSNAGARVPFGLSKRGHLYARSQLLAKNCTSFLVTHSHVIFTTNNHYLKFVHLAQGADSFEVPGDDPETDERCRSIERGARLVTAMPTNMSVVLQMPRGNLETIFPRAMVLAEIRHQIEEGDYGKAFAYCRTQRVDMNILYDHRPGQFLAKVDVFLRQVKDVASIDLFLSSLK